MRRFLTLYMTVNWHREFAVNFATFLKVCRDFFTFAPWFSSSPRHHQSLDHWTYNVCRLSTETNLLSHIIGGIFCFRQICTS